MFKVIFNNLIFFVLQILLCIIGTATQQTELFRFCAFLIFAYCIYKGSQERYVVNPFFLILLTPLSLIIYLNISDVYLADLTCSTWLLIILNINAILIGINYSKPTHYRETTLRKSIRTVLYARVAFYFTIIGIAPVYFNKITGTLLPISYIIAMLATAGLLSAFATKNKRLIAFIFIIYLSPILLGGTSKTSVLTLLIASLIAYEKYFVPRNIKEFVKQKRIIIVGCILAIPMMIFAFSFANKDRGKYDADEGLEYYSDRVEWNYAATYFMPYMYIVTPWANLQYVLETQNSRSYGFYLTKPILGIFRESNYVPKGYELRAYSSFNTFSFIGLHFKDVGYWGSIIVSLFLGFFIKKVYSLFKQSFSPFDATQYVYTAQATLELFFSNHFFGLSYPFMIVILMYVVKKIYRI